MSTMDSKGDEMENDNIIFVPGYLKMNEDEDYVTQSGKLGVGSAGTLYRGKLVAHRMHEAKLACPDIAIKMVPRTKEERFYFEICIML